MTREEKIERARELRAEGLTLREIGEGFGVTPSAVTKWLNPEIRIRNNTLTLERRKDPAVRARKRATDRRAQANLRNRGRCSACAGPMGIGQRQNGVCSRCRSDRHEAFCRSIERLWGEGKSHSEIAETLGITTNHLGVAMTRARREGYHLPYRYTEGKRAGRKFPEQVAA